MLCQKVGGCIQRCMGIDATNAIYNVSYEADKMNNGATEYHENFKKWLTRFQTEDLVGCCAQTDVKGDRMLRPADQPNPGAYVHIKERLKDGIVVAAAKCISPRPRWPTRCWWCPPAPCGPKTRTMPWPLPFRATGTG
jgi:4-hydroxybutyryl-CoA dehydratase / vinylacetyl-CoA-Delta-isomerase